MPDATLTRLIMPTNLCLNGRPDKAFTPHPAVVRRCLMRRWRVLSCLQICAFLRAAFPLFHHLIADLSFSSYR
ncbi:mannitol-1-phosphate 5-dehydrogenase [Escherichia coli M718]|nr:mannitol-1-phosphate 5-dehydrogenase [Escherichia coli M718]ESA59958.1 hypothetical protein HMPREF1589_05632 [Escherichia coli 113290]